MTRHRYFSLGLTAAALVSFGLAAALAQDRSQRRDDLGYDVGKERREQPARPLVIGRITRVDEGRRVLVLRDVTRVELELAGLVSG